MSPIAAVWKNIQIGTKIVPVIWELYARLNFDGSLSMYQSMLIFVVESPAFEKPSENNPT